MTVTITPTGTLAKAIDAVEVLLANSTNFQSRLGVATAAAAKQHIHYMDVPSIDQWSELPGRPCAVVVLDSIGSETISISDSPVLGVTISLIVVLTDNTPDRYRNETQDRDEIRDQDKNAYLDFCNFAGQVFDDCCDPPTVYENDGYLRWSSIDFVSMPMRVPRDLRGDEDFFECAFRLTSRVQ